MSQLRAPGAAQEQARRIVQHLLGVQGGRTVAGVVLVMVGLGWFTDSLYEWVVDLGTWLSGGIVESWWPVHRLIAVSVFLIQLLVLGILARGARKRYRPRVGSEEAPAPVHGLILYLSNARPEQAQAYTDNLTRLADLDDFRARFGDDNWRMPVEAIAHHLPRLQCLIVICSKGPGGSTGQLRLFRNLVHKIFPDGAFQCQDVAELDTRYSGGIDFEDVDRLSQATDDAYAHLIAKGLPHSEILIDVTGGQKTNAIAGTAVALAEGRRIQYIACNRETGACHLSVYDVTYDI